MNNQGINYDSNSSGRSAASDPGGLALSITAINPISLSC